MDLYVVSLATGAVGLGVMAFGGLSHGGHGDAGGHAGGHAHGDMHVGHAGHGGHAHAGHAGHGSHAGDASHGQHSHAQSSGWNWTSLLSPRLLFGLMLGFGAGGTAASPLDEPWRLLVALTAAGAFEVFMFGPIWRFLFRFESKPALTLESAIEDEARAVTGFDKDGCGLVAVDVDGQVIQLLATLARDERERGVRIRSGDMVRIAEIDPARGRCVVTLPVR